VLRDDFDRHSEVDVLVELEEGAIHGARVGLGRKERGGHVAFACVGQDHDYYLPGGILACRHGKRGTQGGSRGDAGKNAFFASQSTSAGHRVIIGHGDDLVKEGTIQNVGHESYPDPRNEVTARRSARENGRVSRLDRDHTHAWLVRFEHFPHAGDRSTGALCRHKDVDLTLRVLPDFQCGGSAMDRRVGGIAEPVEHECSRDLMNHPLSPSHGIGHQNTGGEQNLRAEVAERCHTLGRHRLGHGQDQPVTAYGRDKGQSDAAVPTRWLNQRHPRSQDAPTFFVIDERYTHPVLHAPQGIAHLQLRHHPTRDTSADAMQLDERCLAYRHSQIRRNRHRLTLDTPMYAGRYEPFS
jgi:hypothetical protein